MSEPKPLRAPIGDIVPQKEWNITFLNVKRDSPSLNVFDGSTDMATHLIDFNMVKRKRATLIVEDLIAGRSDELIKMNQKLHIRGQYYAKGLNHRISFHARILKKVVVKDHPALELEIISMVKKISTLYISYPAEDKPVFLEIPIAGAPPRVQVVEMSIDKMMAAAPQARNLIKQARDLRKFTVNFGRAGKTPVRGVVSVVDDNRIEFNFESLSKDAHKTFDSYLQDDFKVRYKRKPVVIDDGIYQSGGKTVYRVKKLKNNALIILEDEDIRQRFKTIISDFDWEIRGFKHFIDAYIKAYIDVNLIVLDVEQGGVHSIDMLSKLVSDNVILPTRFVLVGSDLKEARQDEWQTAGLGLFINEDTPESIIKQKLAKWLKVRKAGAAGTKMFENQPLILAVDDEEIILDLVGRILTESSYNVCFAYDGVEALKMARNMMPDLILMDINLPKMDGLEVLRVLRKLPMTKNIPVVIMTGLKIQDLVETAVGLGISGFLSKPFKHDVLIERIETALKQKGFSGW